MAKRKTHQTNASVDAFIDAIKDETKREDCRAITTLMKSATGQEPKMWGTSIIGFGTHHYLYANGKPAEICKVGFAPRAKSFAFYLPNFPELSDLVGKIGKYRYCGNCLHISKLADVDKKIMSQIVKMAYSTD